MRQTEVWKIREITRRKNQGNTQFSVLALPLWEKGHPLSTSWDFLGIMALLRAYKAIRPMPGFVIDQAPTSHSLTAELFATVKSNGRIGDNTRMVIGGRDIIEASISLRPVFEDPALADYTIVIQRFPRDLEFRRGLLSGVWQNLTDWVAARDAAVLDEGGAEVTPARFLKQVQDAEDGPVVAAVRWAVTLSDCAKLVLQLQCMPASAATLNGKPSMKR
jgi:hypothetical protein